MHHDLKGRLVYTPGSIVSTVLEKELFNITLFTMGAGTSISEHTASRPGTVYVVEGTGSFLLDGKRIHMKQGMLIVMTAGAKHELTAEEDLAFVLTLSK